MKNHSQNEGDFFILRNVTAKTLAAQGFLKYIYFLCQFFIQNIFYLFKKSYQQQGVNMSSNYSIMSFDPYMNNTQIQSKLDQAQDLAAAQSDASIFGDSFGSSVDYSAAYENILDQYYTTLDEIAAAEAAAAAEEAAGEDEAAPAGEAGDDGAAPAGEAGDDGAAPADEAGDDGAAPAGDDEGAPAEEAAGDDEAAPAGEAGDDGAAPAGDDEGAPAEEDKTETTYTEEEQIIIYNAVEDILDATVRVKTGPFSLGTNEKALIEIMSDESLTPELMRGVQAELKSQNYDIFELIRSETSWGTEDILEGYALAKLGGKSKESQTELESYERYQDMDKSSAEYQNYIRKCVSLFKSSVDGWGTDEKVLAYIMSLPQDIRADVEAQYNEKYGENKSFLERGKEEVSGELKKEYWGE